MIHLAKSVIRFVLNLFNTCGENMATAIENRNIKLLASSIGLLLLYAVICIAASLFLLMVAYRFWWLLLLIYIVASALYSFLNTPDNNTADNSTTTTDLIMAEQEAEEDHTELRPLVFNAVASASENTPLLRPRDEFSIDTSREKSFYMDGIMAIHQFEVDVDGSLDRASLDSILRELQRQMNKYAPRFPLVLHEGRPPVVYDLKNTGNFLILEVVLHSEAAKERIQTRKRARIERQQKIGNLYDDF